MTAFTGRRVCTASIQRPDGSASGFRLASWGQQLGLEAAHLAGGGGLFCYSPATDHPAHGWIVGQPVSVVHILIPGQSPEHGLAELSSQGMAAVRAGPGVGENKPNEFGQTKGIVELPKGEQTSVGRDLETVEFQLQARIERDPKSGIGFFTRCTAHLQPR